MPASYSWGQIFAVGPLEDPQTPYGTRCPLFIITPGSTLVFLGHLQVSSTFVVSPGTNIFACVAFKLYDDNGHGRLASLTLALTKRRSCILKPCLSTMNAAVCIEQHHSTSWYPESKQNRRSTNWPQGFDVNTTVFRNVHHVRAIWTCPNFILHRRWYCSLVIWIP